MIQINPLQSYIDGGARAAITSPPSASLVFDLPGKAIWVKGVKLKGIDHTYTFSHDNYITLTNTPGSDESEDILIGVNITLLKQAIDTTYTTGTLAQLTTGTDTTALVWTAKILAQYVAGVLPTTKKMKINGTDYSIYTTESSLPTFLAPTTLGTTGQILACTASGLTWVNQIQNTDYKVTQSSSSLNEDYRVILKLAANNDPETTFVRFSEYLTFNPSTKLLKINGLRVITLADVYVGATSSDDATIGLVPAATSAQRNYFLRGDGTWLSIVQENTWRPIKVGTTDALGSGTDTGTLTFVAGTGITLGWDATNKKITITNSAPDLNHNTDYTTINKGTAGSTTEVTQVKALSSAGVIFEGGTNKFKVGDGTNYFEIPIGTSAESHTHTLSIAVDSGTSSIALAASTKYKLTAGGSTYVFTSTPDQNVQQVDNNNSEWRPILTKNGTGTGTITSTTTFADNVAVYMNGNYLRANLFYTESDDITTTAITRVYCSNDGYIRYKTLAQFTSDIITQAGLTTAAITKSLAPTTSWGATGIGTSDLATGTYAIQVVQGTHYYSGILSWYAAAGGMAEEIDLHYNGSGTPTRIYLRTNNGLLLIAADAAYSSTSFTFNFRKLI